MSYPPFVQRLFEEEKALKAKIDSLEVFAKSHVHVGLAVMHKVLLAAQLDAMKAYHKILAARADMHVQDMPAEEKPVAPDVTQEEIDAGISDVRVTGGGKDETPLPFSDQEPS